MKPDNVVAEQEIFKPALPLVGGKCRCGYVFFPMQIFGCEMCGRYGDDLTPVTLSGRGQVVSKAVVHIHADPKRPPPFAVAIVALEEGPQVRAFLADPPETSAEPGDAVTARLFHSKHNDSDSRLDVGFTRNAPKE
jgi:uncharacterized OB-fold protein